MKESSEPVSSPPMHEDPSRWDDLVESVGPASILVLISRWLSPEARTLYSPEDIWQEALCLSWGHRSQHVWKGVEAYRAWLIEIARNQALKACRAAEAQKRGGGSRTSHFSTLEAGRDTSVASLLPAGSTTPSRIASYRETVRTMEEALSSVPPDLQPLVTLYLFEEMTMQAIAERLEIGLATAWHRFRKGVEIYRRELLRRDGSRSAEREGSLG